MGQHPVTHNVTYLRPTYFRPLPTHHSYCITCFFVQHLLGINDSECVLILVTLVVLDCSQNIFHVFGPHGPATVSILDPVIHLFVEIFVLLHRVTTTHILRTMLSVDERLQTCVLPYNVPAESMFVAVKNLC